MAPDATAVTAFGRYQLQTVLGSGGMGIVYRAWDPQLTRPLAIKVLKQAGADESNRARLVREAQSLARLSHPHVCHVYDVGAEGDEVWVAMELIDGITLRAWAGEHDRAALLGVLLDAAEGIAAAHAAGIVHRDIKPENVLVTREGRAIVTDFGLARLDVVLDPDGSTASMDPQMTATGAVVGTPAYLAPEQLTGSPLDARVDQFAWAVMAWELLTGMRPFPVLAAVRLDAIRVGLRPPATLAKPIAAALARAMQLAPRDRFASMAGLLDAVRAAQPRRSKRTPFVTAAAALLVGGGALAAVKLTGSRASPPAALAPAPVVVALVPADAAIVVPEPAPATAPAPVVDIARITRTPPPRAAALTSEHAPQSVALAHRVDPYARAFSRGRAIGTIDMMCRIPIDASRPDPELAGPIIDWGKVTRHELVTAMLGDRSEEMSLYEVVGQRGTYRFDGDTWNTSIGQFEAKIGELVVVCPDGTSELHELPGAWQGPLATMAAMLPISAPPRTRELAKLAPLHIHDLALSRDGRNGKITLDPDRRYLVHAKVVAADGDRWEMENWWLDVPAGVQGASLVTAGTRLWIVVEKAVLEDQPDGNKPHLVLRAAAVLDGLFP